MTDINALLREQDEAIKWLCRYVSDWGNKCLYEGREGAPRIFDIDKRVKSFLAAGMVAVPQNPTNKMAMAGRDARNAAIWANAIPAQSDGAVLDKISYRAMIAAAEGE